MAVADAAIETAVGAEKAAFAGAATTGAAAAGAAAAGAAAALPGDHFLIVEAFSRAGVSIENATGAAAAIGSGSILCSAEAMVVGAARAAVTSGVAASGAATGAAAADAPGDHLLIVDALTVTGASIENAADAAAAVAGAVATGAAAGAAADARAIHFLIVDALIVALSAVSASSAVSKDEIASGVAERVYGCESAPGDVACGVKASLGASDASASTSTSTADKRLLCMTVGGVDDLGLRLSRCIITHERGKGTRRCATVGRMTRLKNDAVRSLEGYHLEKRPAASTSQKKLAGEDGRLDTQH